MILLLVIMVPGGGRIKKKNDKCQSYEGTNLGYDILCEYVNYDMEVS